MEFDNFARPEAAPNKDSDSKPKKKSVRFNGIVPVDPEVKPGKSDRRPPKRFHEFATKSLLANQPEKPFAKPEAANADKPAVDATEKTGSKAPELDALREGEIEKNVQQEAAKTDKPGETRQRGREAATEQPHPDSQEREPAASNEQGRAKPSESVLESTEDYHEMLSQELEPNQTGGEVVLSLDGTVAEYVVSLHEEPANEVPVPSETMPSPQATEAPAPVFSRQLEQQHQAGPSTPEDSGSEMPQPEATVPVESAPPEPDAGNGGEVPPPEPPHGNEASSASPEPEPNRPPFQAAAEHAATRPVQPAESDIFYDQVAPTAGPAVSPGERPATKQELDEAFARSAQVHEQRGVLSGLLFGTWFANRGLRRNQKRQNKELRRQAKRIEQLSQQQAMDNNTRKEQQIVAANNERQSERRFTGIEKQLANPVRPEKLPVPTGKTERLAQPAERPNVQPAEQLHVPENHHVETSAWHSIEVDNKTGKPVETQSFEYGREYYRERAHENGPKDQRNALAGELAIVAAAGVGATANAPNGPAPATQSKAVPDASRQRSPSSAMDKAKGALGSVAGSLKKTNTQSGPIWPWVVALVAVIIVLVVLIH